MTKPKRWLLWTSVLTLFVGIFVVPSVVLLEIKDQREPITQEMSDRIKIGMTPEEETEILEGRMSGGSMFSMGLAADCHMEDDGACLWVFFREGRVYDPPVFHESQETQWDRLKRKARVAYDGMVALF